MAQPIIVEGQTATNPSTGDRIIYRKGKWYPIQNDPGGGSGAALTEDQGKSLQSASLMAPAEADYRQAIQAGYDPSTAKNGFASFLETVPFMDGLAPLIRDDMGDRGRNAEMRWSEGSLRSRTGAAITKQETAREANMFFPGPGGNALETRQQLERGRQQSFTGVLARTGPARTQVPAYPYTPGRGQSSVTPNLPTMTPQQKAAAARFKGTQAPSGELQNPYIPTDHQQLASIPRGKFYVDTDGQIVRKNH